MISPAIIGSITLISEFLMMMSLIFLSIVLLKFGEKVSLAYGFLSLAVIIILSMFGYGVNDHPMLIFRILASLLFIRCGFKYEKC